MSNLSRERSHTSRRVVVVAVSAPLVVALLGGCAFMDGPTGIFPGGRLRAGELVTAPVTDWSFAAGEPMELQLVEPPDSRTTGAMVLDGRLYVSCDLGFIWRRIPAPARWGASLIYRVKHWHLDAERDGRVVVRIVGKRYERQAVRETDPEVIATLSARFERWAEKTFSQPLGEVPADPPNDIWFFRLDPRPGP